MRGAKRKPDELKVIQGTFRKDRSNADAPIAAESKPRPPLYLSKRAKVIFKRMVGRLDKIRIASATDTEALGILVQRLEEIEILTKQIADEGHVYKTISTAGEETMKSNPAVAMLNEAKRHAQSLLAEFGLTPASRSKVSAKGKRENKNSFAGL